MRPIDPQIPWAGGFGTNHMGLASNTDQTGAGVFRPTGPANAPRDASFTAPGDGVLMWLRNGSQLYAKWDFPLGVAVDRTYAELRLTQVVPDPAAGALGLLTCVVMLGQRGRGRRWSA